MDRRTPGEKEEMMESEAQKAEDTTLSGHLIYPGGPPCPDFCPGPWSSFHDGYSDGYEHGFDDGYQQGTVDAYSDGYKAGYKAGQEAEREER